MIGLIRSSTMDLTIAVNAAPMMIPTAMFMTLPLAMKSLNSLSMFSLPLYPFKDDTLWYTPKG